MQVNIKKAELGGTVKAIASKSFAHRLLICAALCDAETELICSESSGDIEATVRCLNALGARISRTKDGFLIMPVTKETVKKGAALHCGESGATLRFLLPVSCALYANAAFYPEGRLPYRPLSPLYEQLLSHGCTLSGQGTVPFKSGGKLKSGRFTLPGNVSSQFISGLLLALPLLEGDSVLEITGDLESESYIDMTLSALSAFGVKIGCENNNRLFLIKGNQQYRSPGIAEAESDWSNAAFWLCAGALSERGITCTHLNPDSLQGDRAVTDILARFGANVDTREQSVTVRRGRLRGIGIDARNIPDLVPVLCAVASAAEGETVIKNAQRLKNKESDRLMTVYETLTALGADVLKTEDGLIGRGKPRLAGGKADSFGDHRIAMTAAVLSCICENEVSIVRAEAVDKSYPGFFRDFAALGGKIECHG
jgi:3-phosphoshikimate 1-carboxyvinyltransferase